MIDRKILPTEKKKKRRFLTKLAQVLSDPTFVHKLAAWTGFNRSVREAREKLIVLCKSTPPRKTSLSLPVTNQTTDVQFWELPYLNKPGT